MATAAVSTPIVYNPPTFTRHCGQVHCTETLEDFLINCTTCSQEFNLLSCNLFIKHVKKCTVENIANGNNQNAGYAIENIFTAAEKDDSISDVQSGANYFDPLMSMKVEVEPSKLSDEQTVEDVEPLSDCKDEEDLVARRSLIEGIISEYKKHPELWDSNLQNTAVRSAKHKHYKQIRRAINSRFKTNFKHLELRNQILSLKSGYKRALQKKNKLKIDPKLWYYDKMTFIDGNDSVDQDPACKKEIDHDERSSDDTANEPATQKCKIRDRKLILDIIDQYKKNSLLWDASVAGYSNKAKRNEALCEIACFIQRKHKKNVTAKDISRKIDCLRSGYRSAIRRTSGPITLWYYDAISFVFDKGSQPSENDCQVLEEPPIDEMAPSEFKIEPPFNQSLDETQDYENNDQQSNSSDNDESQSEIADGLSEEKIVLSLIEEYKKHPCLWNNKLYNASARSDRHRANRLITNAINTKFNRNFHETQIRLKIIKLRSSYRRVLRSREAFERDSSHCKRDFPINLYYFKKLSFIGATYSDTVLSLNGTQKGLPRRSSRKPNKKTDDDGMTTDSDEGASVEMKVEEQSDDDEESTVSQPPAEFPTDALARSKLKSGPSINQSLNETRDCETLDADQNSDTDGHDLNNRNVVLSLIEEYKQHACLWDCTINTSSRHIRSAHAFQAITAAVNAKFDKTFTESEIVDKIAQLKRSYRRVLRQRDASKQNPSDANEKFDLFYFDNLAFIGTTDSDTEVSIDHSKPPKAVTAVDSDDDSITENKSTAPSYYDDNSKPYKGKLTDNIELLTCIIEEYKKHPSLWSEKEYNKNTYLRRIAYGEIAETVRSKFDMPFTFKAISYEIRRLRVKYLRLTNRKKRNPKYNTKMWYADMLSFLDNDDADSKKRTGRQSISNDDDSLSDSSGKDEGITKGRCQTANLKKQNILNIIDLYKAAPVLWDTNHPRFTMRNDRKKAFENILSSLDQEIDITAAELRYQIRYVRESYFRVLRSEIANKEGDVAKYHRKCFFHDRMSFLEPFVKKKQSTAPQLQIDTQPDPGEDFTYLTDNRQLMISFIELYKEQGCLWDQKHKDVQNPTAESESYDKIIAMFEQSDVRLTKTQVRSAISFLHSTVVSTQKAFEADDINEASKQPVWFYEHLSFLGKIPRIIDKFCTHCNQDFRTLREYERHKIEIAGDFPYKCTICERGFLSRPKYNYHQLTHRQPHKCELCDFQAADKNNFQVHMLRHKGIKPYRCDHCDKGFFTSSEVGRHLKMHTGEKPIVCDICGISYTGTSSLRRHMKRHRNERDHKCELCGNAFFSQKCLRDHMTTHSDERKHVCETCGAAFKRKKTLLQHKPLHAEQKRHACKICGKLFAQKAGVYSHMKSHGLVIGNS